MALDVGAERGELNFFCFLSHTACLASFKSQLLVFWEQLCSPWCGCRTLVKGRLWVKTHTAPAKGKGQRQCTTTTTQIQRTVTGMAKYLQHLPSTELQNSGVKRHCNSPLSPPRNHAASDGDHTHKHCTTGERKKIYIYICIYISQNLWR